MSKVTSCSVRKHGEQQSTTSRVDEKSAASRGIKCFNYNEKGHIAEVCPKPQKKQRCEKCKEVSHDSKECKTSSTISNLRNLSESVVTPAIVKTVSIDGRELLGFVDTGSDCSLILMSAVPAKMQRYWSGKLLHGFGGAIVESLESIRPTIIFKERRLQVELNMVEDEMIRHTILLGRDILFQGDISLGQGLFVIKSGVSSQEEDEESNSLLLSKSGISPKFEINRQLDDEGYNNVNGLFSAVKKRHQPKV